MTQGERDSSGGELTSFLHLTGKRPLFLILIAGIAGAIGVFLALGEPATFQARYVLNVDRVADNDLAVGEVGIVAEEIVSTASFPEVQAQVEQQTGLVFEDDYEIVVNRAGGALININVVSEQPADAQNVAIETGIAAVAITTERQAAGIESSRDQLEAEVAEIRAQMAELTTLAGGINPVVALSNAEATLLQRRADEVNPPTRTVLRADGTIEQVPIPYTGPTSDELQAIVDSLAPIEREFTSLQTAEAALTVTLSDRNNSLRELDSAIRLIESERDTSLVISEVVTEETSRITGLLTGLLLFAVPAALVIILLFTIWDILTKKPEEEEIVEEEPFDPAGELREREPRALPHSSVHRSLTIVENDILGEDDGFFIDNDGVIDVVALDQDADAFEDEDFDEEFEEDLDEEDVATEPVLYDVDDEDEDDDAEEELVASDDTDDDEADEEPAEEDIEEDVIEEAAVEEELEASDDTVSEDAAEEADEEDVIEEAAVEEELEAAEEEIVEQEEADAELEEVAAEKAKPAKKAKANGKPTSSKERARAKAAARSKANSSSNKNSRPKPKSNGSSKRVRDKDGRWGRTHNSKAG